MGAFSRPILPVDGIGESVGSIPISNPDGDPPGSLKSGLPAWNQTRASNWVLRAIKDGVKFPFTSRPPAFASPNGNLDSEQSAFAWGEVQRLLALGAVQRVSRADISVLSPVFVVPKKNGKNRLIIDLRFMNSYMKVPKFSYDNLDTLAPMLQKGSQLMTCDISDAYLHVEVHPDHRQYLGFAMQNPVTGQEEFFWWCTLPFGAAASPQFFTSMLRPVSTYLTEVLGIQNVIYMDDLILVFPTEAEALSARPVFLAFMRSLGWHLSGEKSDLRPSPVKTFLGMVVNCMEAPTYHVPAPRIRKVRADIRRLLRQAEAGMVPVTFLQRIAGQCVSMTRSIAPAKLMLRSVFRDINSGWDTPRHKRDYVPLSPAARRDLQWWLDSLQDWNGLQAISAYHDLVFSTDASHIGGGVVFGDQKTLWNWTPKLRHRSSNYRELATIYFAVLTFLPHFVGKTVLVKTDNVTAVAHINKFGSRHTNLNHLARALHNLCFRQGITLRAKHVPGKSLETTPDGPDGLSRTRDTGDWRLNPDYFRALDRRWGPHTCDCFASFRNTQVPAKFYTRFPDPSRMEADCLLQDLSLDNNWINPPWRLLEPIVRLLKSQGATATIIAPFYPRQWWFSQLREMSLDLPIELPNLPTTFLSGASGHVEPHNNPKWRSFAFRVSGSGPAVPISPEKWRTFFSTA
jgi:hypothetical protein